MKNYFTVDKTNIIKGSAILLLLFHHLFYGENWDLCTPLHSAENFIVPEIASYSKVCVAIFLIVSGYGLTRSYEKFSGSAFKFSLSHLFKIMWQFWFIYVIFVPLSFVLGNRNPIVIYSTGTKGLINSIIDFLGISNLVDTPTMNATWWYMGIIILLYVLFPLLFKLIKTHPIELLLVSFLFAIMIFFIPSRFNYTVFCWIFPFVEGIFLAKNNILNGFVHNFKTISRVTISLFAFLITVLLRNRLGVVVDGFLGLAIILLINELSCVNSVINKCLYTLGKYSANIFMMHTFIYSYYFKAFFYSLKYPILIYISILITCLIIAIILEKLKELIKYNKLHLMIQKFINGG